MLSALRRGFTLLEVMISLAILALALATIAGINANSFESSNYARHITVATLLARSKMLDVEELLRKDGFSDSDKEYDGDFSDEGYSSMKWTATVRKVEVDVGQLVGGLFGGEVQAENLPDAVTSFLGASKGESDVDPSQLGAVEGNDLSQMLGGGMMEAMFKQVGDTLANSIREVTLEISWGSKQSAESLKFVQYVTTTGRLAMPQGIPDLSALTGQPPGQRPGDRNEKTMSPSNLPKGKEEEEDK